VVVQPLPDASRDAVPEGAQPGGYRPKIADDLRGRGHHGDDFDAAGPERESGDRPVRGAERRYRFGGEFAFEFLQVGGDGFLLIGGDRLLRIGRVLGRSGEERLAGLKNTQEPRPLGVVEVAPIGRLGTLGSLGRLAALGRPGRLGRPGWLLNLGSAPNADRGDLTVQFELTWHRTTFPRRLCGCNPPRPCA
jgi:hypothetical protein